LPGIDAVTGRRRLAVASWVATVAGAAISLGILVLTLDTPVPASWGFRGASALYALVGGTVGAIVAIRRPDNLNGWLFCVIGLFFGAEAVVNEYVIVGALAVPGGLPGTTALAWLLTWIWVPSLGTALIFLPLLFPTGRLLSPRWRAVAVLGAIAIVVFSVAVALLPGPIVQATYIQNPLGLPGVDTETYASVVVGPAWVLLGIAIALALASLVQRFRRASGDARQQIKWFALATLIAGAAVTLQFTSDIVSGSVSTEKALEILVILSLMGVPVSAGMAILRYRLYDIDRIVSRTISYGLVTALLVAMFLLANLALQALLSSVTSSNAWAVAGSTLLAAALFTPVRRQVQNAVDRRFNRGRYDAERTTAAFSELMRDQVDLPTLARELDATVRQAIAPSSVGLWLRGGGR
jgi:hypothetical protein